LKTRWTNTVTKSRSCRRPQQKIHKRTMNICLNYTLYKLELYVIYAWLIRYICLNYTF
jgi:hypothetical protein